MEQTINLKLQTSSDIVFEVVSDLETYPDWLDIVENVLAESNDAWFVTLTAKIGPIKRSKKLRMIRTVEDNTVNFIRQETHDREFSIWEMTSTVTELSESSSNLLIELNYSGAYWSSLLDALFEAKKPGIEKSLKNYLAEIANESVK